MSPALPPDWSKVLEGIQESLQATIQEADARQAIQANSAPPLLDYREVIAAALRTRQEGLADKVQALEQACREVDTILGEEENALREKSKGSIALSRRLEEWLKTAKG